MHLRPIIALFMGLVIQLSQVQVLDASEPAKSCGDYGSIMTCCEGLQACPCASEGKPNQNTPPLAPAAVSLKVLISKAAEPIRLEAPVSNSPDIVVSTESRLEWINGYAGVPLAVAFCRFVI